MDDGVWPMHGCCGSRDALECWEGLRPRGRPLQATTDRRRLLTEPQPEIVPLPTSPAF